MQLRNVLAIGAALVIIPLTGATECEAPAPQDGHEEKRKRDGRDEPVFKNRKKSPKPKPTGRITVCKKDDPRWVCPQD